MDTLMMELLLRLGWTSVQSAVLVGLVWGVCRLLPGLPAATRCGLWWLVAAQAVLGLVWNSPLELAVLPAATTVTTDAAAMTAWQAVPASAAPQVDTAVAAANTPMAFSWPVLALALWAAGVLVLLLHSLRGYRSSRALVRGAADCTDATLQQSLQLAAEAHGLRRAPALKISAQIRSPQLIGPWNPVLLLPARELAAMRADDLDMALTHELVHLQRRDLWWGLLPALAQHLFFFHPLVHLAAREYALAREEACDSAVVAGHGHCRQDYGRLLVQLGVAPRPAVGVASASPNFRSLKRRLLTLQQTRRFPRVAAMAITAVFVLVGVAPLRLVAAVAPPPPPAPPAAPAAPTAPVPRAPPTVVVPAAPPAPPAPPAPAEPSPGTTHSRTSTSSSTRVSSSTSTGGDSTTLVTQGQLDLSRQPAEAFVLMGDGNNFMNGSVSDLRQAQRHAQGNERVLWVRKGDARYVIRDPQVLAQLGSAYQDVARLGQEQAALGERQAVLGERQAAFGQRMADISTRASRDALDTLDVAAIANQAAAGAHAAVPDAAQLRDIQALARQQAELGTLQGGLGNEQARLGRLQAQASAKAAREVQSAVAKALASGKAQRVRD